MPLLSSDRDFKRGRVHGLAETLTLDSDGIRLLRALLAAEHVNDRYVARKIRSVLQSSALKVLLADGDAMRDAIDDGEALAQWLAPDDERE